MFGLLSDFAGAVIDTAIDGAIAVGDFADEHPILTKTVMASIAGGLGAGSAAPIVAAQLGKAGWLGSVSTTGTAINTLNGQALTNAALAKLGGGALKTGGFGMAGGKMVIGGAGTILSGGSAAWSGSATTIGQSTAQYTPIIKSVTSKLSHTQFHHQDNQQENHFVHLNDETYLKTIKQMNERLELAKAKTIEELVAKKNAKQEYLDTIKQINNDDVHAQSKKEKAKQLYLEKIRKIENRILKVNKNNSIHNSYTQKNEIIIELKEKNLARQEYLSIIKQIDNNDVNAQSKKEQAKQLYLEKIRKIENRK